VLAIDPEQFSFGRSLNIGCEAARGDILVFASAHVYPVYDNWLAELTAPLDDQKAALAYGRQLGDERTKYSESRVMAQWFSTASVTKQTHPFCNNANAAIPRSAWEAQPYDETLTGLEDVDWAKRQMDKGFTISYVATAPVVHAHNESWAQLVNRYRREAIAHRRIYRDHAMGPLEALRLAAANVASDYVHATRDGVLLRNVAAIPAFRAAQFWGTYRGFNQRGEASAALRRHFYYPPGWRRQGSAQHPDDATPIDYSKSTPAQDADVRTD
jgi:GT2 family glycosyltransferase